VDLDGEEHRTEEKDLVVLAWSGIGCPMARVYVPRLSGISDDYQGRVSFFQIHSNLQDKVPDIREELNERPVSFPVVRDRDGELARTLGAERTTDVIVLERGVVRYHGSVDDQYSFEERPGEARDTVRKASATTNYLRDALDALLAGESPPVAVTPRFGCALGLRSAASFVAKDFPGPTFHRDVEPLFQKHCQDCHREKGIGPFALTNYEDAAGWAEMIAEVVADGSMPPWHADRTVGEFSNDRSLKDSESKTILDWVAAGAPKGDPDDSPKPRSWEEGWTIGKPDAVFSLPEFEVPADGRVEYRYVTVETNFEEDRWVQAAEFSSTGGEVVHHVLSFVERKGSWLPWSTGSKRPWRPRFRVTDLLQGAPRSEWGKWGRRTAKYTKHLRIGNAGGMDGFFLGAAAGDIPIQFPEGRAKLLPKGAKIVCQVHYTPNGKPTKTITSLGLRFAKTPPPQAIESHAIATVALEIPPGESKVEVAARHKFKRDGLLLSMAPHMHLRGRAFRFELELPDGTKEEVLRVSNFDFDWQPAYVLAEPREIPKGSVLRATGIFDNSEANPHNPNPKEPVFFGLQSDEEMMIGYFEVVWDQKG
ncbi:MAG: hypothetical protein AAF517_25265, partial [Planctomycetota bacterium]